MKRKLLTNTFIVALLAMVCCILWGSAFPCIKIGYNIFDISGNAAAEQIEFAGIRFAIAGVMVIVFGSIINRKILFPKGKEWTRVIILSMFQTIYQYVFFYLGLAHTTGVKSSIIIGSNVFIAIFAACFVFHQEKFNTYKLIGCVAGFAGVILINVYGSSVDMSFAINGEGFIFLAATSYAISSALMKKYSVDTNTMMLSGYQFLFGGVIMTVFGIMFGAKVSVHNGKQGAMLIYLSLISAVAYSLWSILLKYNDISKVSVFGFMNPVCGVILSAILLREGGDAFGVKSIVSLVLVCIGIVIVNVGNKFNCRK